MKYYSRKVGENKELLINHLKRTSELCGQFTVSFNNKKIGEILGSHHDIGKATKSFQDVLFNNQIKVDHAIVGAWFVSNFGSKIGIRELLAYIIASHHFYLETNNNISGPRTNNELDLTKKINTADNNKESSISSLEEYMYINEFVRNNFNTKIKQEDYFNLQEMTKNQRMFYMRMLYSCLVDADFTASAEFSNKHYLDETKGEYKNPNDLLEHLINYKNKISQNSNANKLLNDIRDTVFTDCGNKGQNQTNLFTLTAPTGTGKTLALLNFGLQQLIHQKKERIIIVLPFLSIIEQNAKIYKEICGENVVFIDDSNTEYTEKTKLLSDRWDSQIIITTSVKFFETLFKAKSTNLRRLHNISNSVIVFDESQSLNTDVLDCTIDVINELTKRYNSTVLFSSATQLNYMFRKNITWQPIEIINDVKSLYEKYAKTKNLNINWDIEKPKTYKDLCKETTGNSSLYMFNTKKLAKKMYKEMLQHFKEEECFLVSNDLSNQHKLDVINKIIERLKNNQPTRIVATQCIEAGVDISIEDIFRQQAPYSSIIQSSGRCDRNGTGKGKFTVFELLDEEFTEKKKYPGEEYRNAAVKVKTLLKNHGGYIDINNLDILNEYSQLLFTTSTSAADKEDLKKAIDSFDFLQTSKEYKLIENDNASIIVPYSKCIEEYRKINTEITNNDFCITKKLMKDSRKLIVTTYETKENILNYCSQLFVRVGNEKVPINWYLLDESLPYYNCKTGLDFTEPFNLTNN